MKLSEGSLYVVKKDKEWVIAMFTGYEQGRARGVVAVRHMRVFAMTP